MENMDINALLAAPKLKDCKKVLCVQPHPDDNEIGMGGVIAKLAREGCEIHYLTITDGRLGDTGTAYTPDELAEVRKQEAESAGRFLGVQKFLRLNHKDGSLHNIPALAAEIAEVIRRQQYDTVFCPDPWNEYEAHYDHIVTGKACAQAAIACSLKNYPEGTNTAPCRLQAVGFYYTASPNTVVDVTDYFDQKFEAVALHKTQIDDQTLAMYRMYFTLRGKRMTESESIGEGLRMLRPLHLHCFPEANEIR